MGISDGERQRSQRAVFIHYLVRDTRDYRPSAGLVREPAVGRQRIRRRGNAGYGVGDLVRENAFLAGSIQRGDSEVISRAWEEARHGRVGRGTSRLFVGIGEARGPVIDIVTHHRGTRARVPRQRDRDGSLAQRADRGQQTYPRRYQRAGSAAAPKKRRPGPGTTLPTGKTGAADRPAGGRFEPPSVKHSQNEGSHRHRLNIRLQEVQILVDKRWLHDVSTYITRTVFRVRSQWLQIQHDTLTAFGGAQALLA